MQNSIHKVQTTIKLRDDADLDLLVPYRKAIMRKIVEISDAEGNMLLEVDNPWYKEIDLIDIIRKHTTLRIYERKIPEESVGYICIEDVSCFVYTAIRNIEITTNTNDKEKHSENVRKVMKVLADLDIVENASCKIFISKVC